MSIKLAKKVDKAIKNWKNGKRSLFCSNQLFVTFSIFVSEIFKKHYCKLDEILRNYYFWCFSTFSTDSEKIEPEIARGAFTQSEYCTHCRTKYLHVSVGTRNQDKNWAEKRLNNSDFNIPAIAETKRFGIKWRKSRFSWKWNQSRICGKGVGLSLFPSDSLHSQLYEFIEIAHIDHTMV